MCSVGGAGTAELHCSVLEEDWQRGQSYSAHWQSLSPIPQHCHRQTVMEVERSGRHSLLRQCEARRLLQRCLSGAISQGPLVPETHRASSPHRPGCTPSAMGAKVQRASTHVQDEVWCVTLPKRAVVGASLGRELPTERKAVVRMPKCLGRELSHKVHRG